MRLTLRTFLIASCVLLLAAKYERPKWDAIVVKVSGDWQFTQDELGKPAGLKLDRKRLKPMDAAEVNLDSCAKGNKGSLTVLINNDLYCYKCDVTEDGPCKLSDKDKKNFTCIRNIIPIAKCHTNATQESQSDKLAKNDPTSMAAVGSRQLKDSGRFVSPLARGLEAELSDGVVLVEGSQVDLAPAFRDMNRGTYRIRIASSSSSVSSIAPVQVRWLGEHPTKVAVPGVHPGLYRVLQLDSSDEPTGSEAWLLLSDPVHFPKDSEAFHSAAEATKNWSDDVGTSVSRALLRAYLDGLSRQLQTAE